MNRAVVIVVAVVVIIAAVTAILLLNHSPSNHSSTPQFTSSVSTTTISTSTSTTTTSTTSSESITNVSYNTFYFLNKTTNSQYYYIFVVNYSNYKTFLQMKGVSPNSVIITASITGTPYNFQITKTIVDGNYMFVIGYSVSNVNITVGSIYYVSFVTNSGPIYTIQMTYEGIWAGSIP
ncbi:hypothetical protein [Saccharolobus islandicus]|uniref:Uncharacterized protein n=1 Tax=Saccharolobus islandicus (strain M.16.27) TaxID=427318 RepID=C3N609_SACI3|nr:hypothetical protein [Sulfolobus islandicus]ACP55434.1 hypothetical protein M1627_1550 [Sulfolobus islandicus M.16.27]